MTVMDGGVRFAFGVFAMTGAGVGRSAFVVFAMTGGELIYFFIFLIACPGIGLGLFRVGLGFLRFLGRILGRYLGRGW